MKRRVLAIFMATALCVGLLPATTFAATGEDASEDAEETTTETDVQAADIVIAEDGTATIVLDDVEGGEEQTEEAAETAQSVEAESEGEVEEPAEEETEPEEAVEEEAEPEEVIYTGESESISVKVAVPVGALPEDAELKVERYAEDSDEYRDAVEAINLDEESGMAALDISFLVAGEEVEPTEPVKVSIDVSEILPDDADASTLEVQHLKEGRDGQIKAEVVANDSAETEGTIDEEKATAEFEVESFSTFTVEWNDGTGTSITVHVYNINGTSIDEELDEESYLIADNGTITISEIVNHLEQNASYTSTYTFAYATIYYETTNNQGGFDPGTIGDEDNSVTQITKSGTNYDVTYGSNSTTLEDPYVVTIHLYYSLPAVTLTATENTDGTVSFTTESSYFTGDTEEAEYHWALNDDSYGSITPGENGTATFTWSEDAVVGDQVSVTVTMTVGNETAADTYTLTYGTESTTITVTINGTTQADANVALVNESGNTIATGKTGDDGTITLDVTPGTYTVGVTYVTYDTMGGGSTTRYTNSGTVTVAEDGTITGDTTINLTTAVTSGPNNDTNGSGNGTWSSEDEYYYEHIDVKVAVAEGADADAVFSDLDRVYVYDEYGNLIYYSLDLVENDDTTDYNGLFDVNGTEGHSLVISSKDTIILVFEVYDNTTNEYKTYTETITPSTTYPADEYYSYSDVNAYQLYNSINGTNISEDDWETALNNDTLGDLLGDGYDPNGIDIGGMSFIQVADYLCDTRGISGQAGLDFVIDVGLISVLYEDYDLQIAKSLEDVPDSVENVETFEFTLQELSTVSDSADYTEAVWDTVNNALGEAASASTGELTKEADGTWSAIADFEDFLEYEAEEGTTLFYYVLSEKDAATATAKVQYYGIKISVDYSSITGIATVTASYCELIETNEEGVYNRNSGWTGLTAYTGEDEDGEYTYYSIPFINTYDTTGFAMEKVDQNGEPIDGAAFTMATSDGTSLYFISDDEGTVYTLSSESEDGASDEITVTNGGPVYIQGLTVGATYTLTESTTPHSYATVGDFTVTITVDVEGNKTVTVVGSNYVSVAEESDTVTVTDVAATSITVEKVWDDANVENVTHPEITVTLSPEGEAYESEATLNEENEWTYTWEDLPVYDSDGEEIEYDVTETIPDGFEVSYGGLTYNEEDGTYSIEITNTYAPKTEITVEKVWNDANVEGVTHPEITVTLTPEGEGYDSEVTLNGGNEWTYTWKDLPVYDTEGAEIEYAVTEAVPDGFEVSYGELTYNEEDGTYSIEITNTYAPKTEISVEKEWVDNDDENGNRPASITVTITGSDGNTYTLTLSDENDWSDTQSELPLYDSTGTEIIYEVTEEDVTGYDGDVVENEDGTYTITNTLQTTDISVIKVWNDDENRDGTRTGAVQVQLKAGEENVGEAVTLDDEDDWTFTWEDLPVYVNGEKVDYTIEEVEIPDKYTASYTSETDDDGNVTFTMVNTHEDALTQITVNKEWQDADNKNGVRPESVTVQLMANDAACGDAVTLDESNGWSYTWEDLYSFENGEFIEYTVEEEAVERYNTEIGELTPVYDDDNNLIGYDITVTNTFEMVDLSGSKVWENDEESDRPESITIYLYADGEEVTDADGNAVTATATADDDWAWSFTDLPKYQLDGETEIEYTVLEGEIADSSYIPTYDTDEDGKITITNAIPVVEKDVSDPAYGESTDDNLHQDETDNNDTLEYKMEADHIGGAHDLVLHDFLSDQLDMTTLEIQSVTLYADENDEGTLLVEGEDYDVTQGECTAECGLDGCSFEIHVYDKDVEDLSADAYVIVIFDIEVKEDVEDFDSNYVNEIDNFVGLSFTAFNIRTYAEPDETETYSYGFDLYKYATDTDDPLEGAEFILAKAGDDGTVYAQFEDPTEDNEYLLTGWTDSRDDATAIISGSDGNAVIEGLHDGEFILTETKTPDGYTYTKQETTIVISVDEEDPLNPTIIVDEEETDDEVARIANAPGDEEQIPEKAVSIDDDNVYYDGDKDVSVGDTLTYEIRYYNHYSVETTVTIKDCLNESLDFVEASDGGTYDEDSRTVTWIIENAPAYAWGSVTVTVTVNENALAENQIENTASVQINSDPVQDTNPVDNPVPDTRDISGSKTWDDDNDKADARPDSITVNLYQNGQLYDSKTVTAEDGWTWSWDEVPKYDENGQAYAYTIDEDEVEYYIPTYKTGSFDITNTFVGEEGAETTGGTGSPKTSDTNNIALWLTLLIAAMACAVVGFRMRKRS